MEPLVSELPMKDQNDPIDYAAIAESRLGFGLRQSRKHMPGVAFEVLEKTRRALEKRDLLTPERARAIDNEAAAIERRCRNNARN